MKKLIKLLICVFAVGGLATSACAADDSHAASTLNRQLLLKKRVTLPEKSLDAKVIRVQFPVGYKTPVHTHEGPGPRYVVKGTLKVEDAGETQVFSSGEVFWETGGAMTVENVGGGEAEIIIFEMAPAK